MPDEQISTVRASPTLQGIVELSFTDGSRKTTEKDRAGWGAFLPQNADKSCAAFNKR
jgi:hypothetical protein